MSDVADIFREYGDSYRGRHKLPLRILKTMTAIENCRTSRLGGHVDECDECGHISISYNSCRNRHCPKCLASAKERWLEDRMQDLLPVGYFHIVLTIPQELNPLVLRNQEEMYNILFKAGSETLLELGRDIKHLGAEIGFIAILHTWGQNLMDHPHLHCVVPGGGLSLDGERWVPTKRKDFFIHVKPLSALFMGKFLHYTQRAYREGKLKFPGEIIHLRDEIEFTRFTRNLYKKEWVVYCKPPFGGPEQVLEYIGRYTHRVAISNSRIRKIENGVVTFRWKDYKDGNRVKEMSITAEEFIRRFLMHVLPDGFVKIRHYGILSSRNKKTKLKRCRELLGCLEPLTYHKAKDTDLLCDLVETAENLCPCCGEGRMRTRRMLLPDKLSPPGGMEAA